MLAFDDAALACIAIAATAVAPQDRGRLHELTGGMVDICVEITLPQPPQHMDATAVCSCAASLLARFWRIAPMIFKCDSNLALGKRDRGKRREGRRDDLISDDPGKNATALSLALVEQALQLRRDDGTIGTPTEVKSRADAIKKLIAFLAHGFPSLVILSAALLSTATTASPSARLIFNS